MASNIAKRVFSIVCTGGPCGGKSTALPALSRAFQSHGFNAYTIPEMPTLIKDAGFKYPGPDGGKLLEEFEFALFDIQRTFEDRARELAIEAAKQDGKPIVLVLDRSLLDIKAYMVDDLWHATLRRACLSEQQVYDRYDYILHLVTAASGAEEFYTCLNNSARTEGLEEAIRLDKMVCEVYKPIEHKWKLVPNRHGGFPVKLKELVDSAVGFVLQEMESSKVSAPLV